MAIKTLLTRLTTKRDGKRVTFAANQAVDLTKEELAELDKLEKKTGRPHYRDPINEKVEAEEPAEIETETEDTFDGESVAMDDKTVDQLKAYLDHNSVEYSADDKKADLLKVAKRHETDGGL